MTTTTFDDALASLTPRVLAWNNTPRDGRKTLSVFSLAGGGAEQVAWQVHPEGDQKRVTTEFRAAGHRVGEYDDSSDFVWVAADDSVTVWDAKERALFASGDKIELAGGRIVAKNTIEVVRGWVDEEEYVDRGVQARLRDGTEVDLLYEPSLTAAADPFYSRNELICDTEWVSSIAAEVAMWAGARYQGWF